MVTVDKRRKWPHLSHVMGANDPVLRRFIEDNIVTVRKSRVVKSGQVTTLTPPLHPMCRCAMGLVEVEPVEEVFEPTPPEQPDTNVPFIPEEWDNTQLFSDAALNQDSMVNRANNIVSNGTWHNKSDNAAKAMKEHVMRTVGDGLGEAFDDDTLRHVLDKTWETGSLLDPMRVNANQVKYQLSDEIVSQWAETSGDDSILSLLNQRAASDTFDLPWPPVGYEYTAGRRTLEAVDDLWSDSKIRDVLTKSQEIMYQTTQQELNLMFPDSDSVLLFRGVKSRSHMHPDDFTDLANLGINPSTLDVTLNPLSSFSLSPATAVNFAEGGRDATHVLIGVRVPKSRIHSTVTSGFGCFREGEMVVLGGTASDSVQAIVWSGAEHLGPGATIRQSMTEYLTEFLMEDGGAYAKPVQELLGGA